MSSGRFTRSVYESDRGTKHAIRVQPETLTASFSPGGANGAASGTATSPGSAKVSGSKRSVGVSARLVRLQFTGAAPDGYAPNAVLQIPVLQPSVFNAIEINNSTASYLGAEAVVIGKTAETIR